MVVMTLQRPVKVMDWDPGEANCLCGKFIGGCRCLRSTRPPGGWNAWNARRARPLQLNAPVPGPCRLLRWMDAWASFEGGEAEHTLEKLCSLRRGRKPPPPLPRPAAPPAQHTRWRGHSPSGRTRADLDAAALMEFSENPRSVGLLVPFYR